MKKAEPFLVQLAVKRPTVASITGRTLNLLSRNYSVIVFYEVLALGLEGLCGKFTAMIYIFLQIQTLPKMVGKRGN